MRVTVERANLLRCLSHMQRVVERRNTIPILGNVLIRAVAGKAGRPGELHFKATDLDMEAFEKAPAEVARAGAVTVPAHMLYDIVRKLPDGAELSLDSAGEGQALAIQAGRARFSLQMLPEGDFPDVATGEFGHAFVLPAGALRRLIEHTQFAISTEETRYYLNGIYLHVAESEGTSWLRAVATDGHRLARSQVEAPDGAAGMPGVIVPRKAVGEILRLVEDPDAEVGIELSESKIRVTVGPVVLTSKLIDGTFPDYNRVIPANNDKELQVDRDSFQRAVDRVSTIASERGRAVKMALSDGQLVLTVNNPDSGSATEELPVGYDAAPLEIGFNARYLLDITGQLSGEQAVFRLADPGSPTLIQDSGDSGAIYVLMPMRV